MAPIRPTSRWPLLAVCAALTLAAPAARGEDVCTLTDPDAFLDRCPTSDPAFGKLVKDFRITRDGVPVTFNAASCTEPVSAMPVAAYTDELSLLQLLRVVYYLDKDRCGHLPWTSLSLYEWMRSKISGFNFDSAATANSCCYTWPDGTYFARLQYSNDVNRNFHRTWEGMASWISLLMHETRHRDGYFHGSGCPAGAGACDPSYDESDLSAYGINYWLERAFVDGRLHSGYTCLSASRIMDIKNMMRSQANGRILNFQSSPPPLLTDANNPPPPCDNTCAASVTCVAPAQGVPPAWQPPVWWSTSPPQPAYHDRVDDPRWSGASKLSYGDGTGEKAEVRLLHDGASLYLSWRALLAPASSPAQDTLYFGYRQAGGGDVIVKVELGATGPLAASGAYTLTANLRNPDGTLGAAVTPPAELTSTARVWAEPATSGSAGSWAIQLKLPVAALRQTCDRVQLWYQLLAGTPTAPVASFAWPRAGAAIDGGTVASPHPPTFPDPALWHWFRPSTGPGDPRCATGGVSLAWGDVGTTNTPSSEIRYRSAAPFPANTLYARPTNLTGAPIPAGAITASFRLANWGSVPGDWEAGVSASTLWSTIPGGDAVPTAGAIPVGATADAATQAQFSWTVGGADLAAFLGGTRRSHQCMLVELKSAAAGGLTFTNASVYRNMDLVSASTFRREAEVSVKGLPATPAGARDVYVYVETQGLPETVKPPPTGDRRALVADRRQEPSPTYKVHVFHDTGKVLTLGGVARPVLEQQTSYGYNVTHEGEVTGWSHQLEGQGLVELAPNWYRLSIPDGGSARLTTTIEAVEPATPRWSLSLHVGAAVPVGSTATDLGAGFRPGVDLQLRFDDRWALEALLGFGRLPGKGGRPDLQVMDLSLSVRRYLKVGALQPFVMAGPGLYVLSPGTSQAGVHVGAGLELAFTSHWSAEVAARIHQVAGVTPGLHFAIFQAGLRLTP
jgi:hypothetical protein